MSACRQASDGDKSSSNTGEDGGRKSQPGPDDINIPVVTLRQKGHMLNKLVLE